MVCRWLLASWMDRPGMERRRRPDKKPARIAKSPPNLLGDAVDDGRGQGYKDAIDAGGDGCLAGDTSERNETYSHRIFGHSLALVRSSRIFAADMQVQDQVLHNGSPWLRCATVDAFVLTDASTQPSSYLTTTETKDRAKMPGVHGPSFSREGSPVPGQVGKPHPCG